MSKYIIFVIGVILIGVIQVVITGIMGSAEMMFAIIAAVLGAVLTLGLFVFLVQPMLSRMATLEAAKQELDEIRREQEKKRDKTVHPIIPDN